MRAWTAALGLLWVSATPACHRPSDQARQSSTPALMGATSGTSPAFSAMPTPDLGYNAREGRTLFLHYCSTCHGKDGHGDGFNAYNLDPKPRDLGEPAFQAKRTDDELASVVRSGGAAAGLSSGMPPWGRTLNDRQIFNLVSFVRTLRPAADSI